VRISSPSDNLKSSLILYDLLYEIRLTVNYPRQILRKFTNKHSLVNAKKLTYAYSAYQLAAQYYKGPAELHNV
jgi:hypothetical protein